MNDIKDKEHTKDFENSLISEFTKEVLKEQRRNRRWGIFFKLIFVLYVSVFFLMYAYENASFVNLASRLNTLILRLLVCYILWTQMLHKQIMKKSLKYQMRAFKNIGTSFSAEQKTAG